MKATAGNTAFFKSKFIRKLRTAAIILFALFFATFGAFLATVFMASAKTPREGLDAIIVLGAGLNGASPSPILKLRLEKALEYQNENPAAVIVVSGGQGRDEIVSEAAAMKEYLLANGVDSSKILMEDRSGSTKENFVFSREILDEYFEGNEYSVLFVTTGFHVPRAGYYAKKAGLDADSLASAGIGYLIPLHYLREYAATAYYCLFDSWR